MEYKIEDGIPAPAKRWATSLPATLAKLGPGQSVLVEGMARSATHAAMNKAHFRTGAIFTSKKMDGGVRVWRVE